MSRTPRDTAAVDRAAAVLRKVSKCEQCGGPLPPGSRRSRRFCDDCKQDRKLAAQREKRAATNNAATRTYEKTPKGFLMRAYSNMLSRVRGVQKSGTWVGQDILPREDFYAWALGSSQFWTLFKAYVASNYEMRLAPSVNRIDSKRGYTLDNIEWVTHSINSGLANQAPSRETKADAAREAILA